MRRGGLRVSKAGNLVDEDNRVNYHTGALGLANRRERKAAAVAELRRRYPDPRPVLVMGVLEGPGSKLEVDLTDPMFELPSWMRPDPEPPHFEMPEPSVQEQMQRRQQPLEPEWRSTAACLDLDALLHRLALVGVKAWDMHSGRPLQLRLFVDADVDGGQVAQALWEWSSPVHDLVGEEVHIIDNGSHRYTVRFDRLPEETGEE